jgi:hypothetical protein
VRRLVKTTGLGGGAGGSFFLLVSLSTLLLGAARRAAGLVPALAMLAVLTGVALYVVVLLQWPRGGPVSWLEGGLPARGLIAAAGASGVLAAVVLTQALAPGESGRRRSSIGSAGWRSPPACAPEPGRSSTSSAGFSGRDAR